MVRSRGLGKFTQTHSTPAEGIQGEAKTMSFWGSIGEALFTPYDFAQRRKREGPRKFAIDREEFDCNRSDTEMVAKYIHDRYEHHANKCGWATNKLCRVDFEALPSSNRRTMMAVANDLMRYLEGRNGGG